MRPRLLLLVALAACGGRPIADRPAAASRAAAPSPLAAQARAGVADPELAALLVDHLEGALRREPVWATTLGDHRFDRELGDPSDAAERAWSRALAGLLRRARAIDAARLTADERVTLELLIDELGGDLAVREACADHLWAITARDNALFRLGTLPRDHRIDSAAAADALLARYRAIPGRLAAEAANLRLGSARGLVGNDESIRRALAMLDAELGRPRAEWALMVPARAGGPAALAPPARARFVAELAAVVERDVAPALAAYRATVAALAPRARTGAAIGVHALPGGPACYRARIARETGLRRTAAELHQLGLDEIARIDRELVELGNRVFGGAGRLDLAAVIARLRDDRALYFAAPLEIVAAAGAALERARVRLPDVIGRLPGTPCEVAEIPPHEAPFTHVAYYSPPQVGSGKPGEYFVNVHRPEVRARYEMEALSFHESIPGHHVQIALAMEAVALPLFRRHLGSTAFVEGWALYSERLADELSLYSGDLDRMGMLSYDAWRAARLVVDTGIHALGWTRAQAERFMREHTALSLANIGNEVDRYIGWPGQALAYKVGQLEIRALRGQAERALGARFDLRRFHDVVLGSGAVTLGVLRRNVEAWIGAAR